jgi:hypothetical protein
MRRIRVLMLGLMLVAAAFALPAIVGASDPALEGPDKTVAPAQLKWKTRGDSSVYGYLVYRAEKREGPFLRVSREIVHRQGESDEAEYAYTDWDVEAGRTYYYYLDTIGMDGRKRRFSGVIQKTVAKAVAKAVAKTIDGR